jgi:hypothetical protein
VYCFVLKDATVDTQNSVVAAAVASSLTPEQDYFELVNRVYPEREHSRQELKLRV